MPELIVNQAPGAGVKRSWDSSTAIMLDKTVESIVNQTPGAGVKRSRVIKQSEYSDFVFTSLSDAIREWGDSGNSKARNDSPFNIMATVNKWSITKASKGVDSSNIFAQETTLTRSLKDQIYMSRQRCCQMSAIAEFTLLFSLTATNARNQFQLEKKFA